MKTRLSAVGLALILVLCDTSLIGLAARGASPAAFDRRCIPAGGVAPPSNTPGILGRRALPSGRIAGLGATRDLHHGLLGPRTHSKRSRSTPASAALSGSKRSATSTSATTPPRAVTPAKVAITTLVRPEDAGPITSDRCPLGHPPVSV